LRPTERIITFPLSVRSERSRSGCADLYSSPLHLPVEYLAVACFFILRVLKESDERNVHCLVTCPTICADPPYAPRPILIRDQPRARVLHQELRPLPSSRTPFRLFFARRICLDKKDHQVFVSARTLAPGVRALDIPFSLQSLAVPVSRPPPLPKPAPRHRYPSSGDKFMFFVFPF